MSKDFSYHDDYANAKPEQSDYDKLKSQYDCYDCFEVAIHQAKGYRDENGKCFCLKCHDPKPEAPSVKCDDDAFTEEMISYLKRDGKYKPIFFGHPHIANRLQTLTDKLDKAQTLLERHECDMTRDGVNQCDWCDFIEELEK